MKNSIKHQTPLVTALCTLLFMAAMAGCGYKFTGGGVLPGGVTSVNIAIFENRSAETGIENTVVNDLVYEFTRNGQKVVSDPALADSMIKGVIRSVSEETVTYTTSQESVESRVVVVVDMEMVDQEGRDIWSAGGIVAKEAYDVVSDNQEKLQNRKVAIEALSKRLAETIYERLTGGF